MEHFVTRQGTRIHYLDHEGPEPPLILLHGLTANAHVFDGLVAAGLSRYRRLVALDLRGRGRSDQPPSGYAVAEHAADVIAVMDHLGLARAEVCGHSYGALLTAYLATAYKDRVTKAALLDIAGPTVQNPAVFELLRPSLERLGKTWPSLDAFLDTMKKLAYYAEVWDTALESFFRADVEERADGSVKVRTNPETIQQVITEARTIDWGQRMSAMTQPAMLVHASGAYGPPGAPPLVTEQQAREAAGMIPRCRYVHVPGNHMTMLFGQGAPRVADAIVQFLSAD